MTTQPEPLPIEEQRCVNCEMPEHFVAHGPCPMNHPRGLCQYHPFQPPTSQPVDAGTPGLSEAWELYDGDVHNGIVDVIEAQRASLTAAIATEARAPLEADAEAWREFIRLMHGGETPLSLRRRAEGAERQRDEALAALRELRQYVSSPSGLLVIDRALNDQAVGIGSLPASTAVEED